MPHQNTVLHNLLKHIPWDRFEAIIKAHGTDAGRSLTTRTHFLAMLYGQLCGAGGLRETVESLKSHEASLYHLGMMAVPRSTLAEANRYRPYGVFVEMLTALMAQAHRGLRHKMAESIRLIDSTSVSLSSLSARWAQFSVGVCGAKVHVVYDPDADCPVYAGVTASNVNDITAAHAMPITAGATYVFDLGYYDYGWWAELHESGCRIVTRFKTNTPLTVTEVRPVPANGPVLSDRIGTLPKRQANNRKNPFSAPVREVRVRIETGKVLRILTNDIHASAQEIADLYKRRWAIELFFRWVKQNLKIKKFFGTTENAVRIHVAVVLMAFLLLRLAQATQTTIESPLTFARLVRANLLHRRPINQLDHPPPKSSHNPNQLVIQWGAT